MRTLVVPLVLAAAVVSTGPADAAIVAAAPGSKVVNQFATPVATAARAAPLEFVNGDVEPHDVVAEGVYGSSSKPWCGRFAANRCPIFWSDRADQGETASVLGLDQTVAGRSYPFYCTIHPTMKGTLVVA